MSGLSAFYNNLLTIQVTVFGIIIAAMFVLVQIAHATFSDRHSFRLLRDPTLIAYFAISGVTLLCTAAGSLLFSFETHNFIPFWDLHSRVFLTAPWTPATLLLLTGLSIFMFVLIVARNLRYLHPHRVLLLTGQTVKTQEIRLFLFKEYGLDHPTMPYHLSGSIPDEVLKTILPFIEDHAPEPGEAEKEKLSQEIKAAEKRHEDDLRLFNELKAMAKGATDPLDIVAAVASRAIKNSDFPTLKEVGNTLKSMSQVVLASIDRSVNKRWNPDGRLAEQWTEHIIRLLSTELELAEKEGFHSAALTILRITEPFAIQLLQGDHDNALLKLMNYWKRTADNAIGKNKEVFTWIVKTYDTVGSSMLESGDKEPLNQVFRDLGWLGERLLDKKGFETKPVMYDIDYSTEYEELINILLSFGSTYSSRHADHYPLIYFDAIRVVFAKLLQLRVGQPNNADLKNNLFSCMSKMSSFVEPAIRSSNARGAALAVMRLKQCYEELLENNLSDSAAQAVDLLVEAACSAVEFDDKSSRADFMHEGIEEHVAKVLEASPFRKEIAAAIREVYIKSHHRDHDKVWGFITRLARRLHTNFGFMFDWATGKTYPQDSPRRFE